MPEEPKRVRRTKYQIAAARKLKYSIFVGGGEPPNDLGEMTETELYGYLGG